MGYSRSEEGIRSHHGPVFGAWWDASLGHRVASIPKLQPAQARQRSKRKQMQHKRRRPK